MALRISGKNIDVGAAYRTHVEQRLGEALRKYFDGGFTGHVILEREGSWLRTDCTIHLDTGIVLQATGRAQEAHQSLDIAADRIEKRLRRYHRRLKEHRPANRAETEPVTSYVIASLDDAGQADFAVRHIRQAIADDPKLSGRLALWGRRLMGEALTQAQRVAAERDALTALLAGGVDRPGLDLAAIGRMFTRITERHNERMAEVGLSA